MLQFISEYSTIRSPTYCFYRIGATIFPIITEGLDSAIMFLTYRLEQLLMVKCIIWRDGLHLIAWQTLPTAFITAGSGRQEWKHASFTVLRSSLRFISLAKGSCAFLIIMLATVSWWVKIMLCLGFHKHKLSKNNNYCQAKQLMGRQFSSEAVPITLC